MPHSQTGAAKAFGELDARIRAGALDVGNSASARVGEVVSVTGAHALVILDARQARLERHLSPQIGAFMSIDAGESVVLGLVSAISAPTPSHDPETARVQIFELELVGEFTKPTEKSPSRFRRGVSSHPTLGDAVSVAAPSELAALFAASGSASVPIGVIKQNSDIAANVSIEELFAGHCAFLGVAGAGKSCAIALLLHKILKRYSGAHIVVFDTHNEYASSLKDMSTVFDAKSLRLPYWMLSFDEFVDILYPNRAGYEEEIEVFADLIPQAKRMNMLAMKVGAQLVAKAGENDVASISVDTPTPYRVSEIFNLIDKAVGAMGATRTAIAYKRLRNRLSMVTQDARYQFLFGGLTVQDNMVDVIGSIFRIPIDGAPVSVIELGGLSDDVARVVVGVITRLAHEFGMWSRGARPIALICENAHRFAPVVAQDGARSARRALVDVAKEGAKSGISLWVSSQRPTELDPAILTQCNTIFALRMANQGDQEALKAAAPDVSASLLEGLASLGQCEAVVIGEGVTLPTRIRLSALPREAIPHNAVNSFTDSWSVEVDDDELITRVVAQWRAQRFYSAER